MMMMMQSGVDDITKQRMLQARALSQEARGKGLNLGKKISVPKDVMMEELNLPSNRGSRMFQERQRRVERYTLENSADGAHNVRNKETEQSNTMTSIHQTDTPSPSRGRSSPADYPRATGWKREPGFLHPWILPPSERHSSREVQRDSHPQVLLLPVEGSFGGHRGAPEHPRRSTAPDASKNFQLQVLQQIRHAIRRAYGQQEGDPSD
ncbi:uncharacterized protein AB9X84_025173 isoform 3-T4 [Acanthopagrus schlegelii]